ncbi:hypothetical protein IC232_28190 [Microvirga sp. BT688]|uniref:hypothetical protein n=1 Tax=Microvirga sp. TaxID=1873136 RepID=UPI001684C2E4|nr:hypothetical protein [Microvirga sp.]MBD2750535.1 hypothetical protein [Microvirga sp.]
MLLGEGPRALARALRTRNWPLLALALDVMVPPLSLLGAGLVLLWLAALLAGLAGFSLVPLAVLTAAGGLAGASLVLAWARFGRGILSGRDLWQLAVYLLQKAHIYRWSTAHSQTWVRTDRS